MASRAIIIVCTNHRKNIFFYCYSIIIYIYYLIFFICKSKSQMDNKIFKLIPSKLSTDFCELPPLQISSLF